MALIKSTYQEQVTFRTEYSERRPRQWGPRWVAASGELALVEDSLLLGGKVSYEAVKHTLIVENGQIPFGPIACVHLSRSDARPLQQIDQLAHLT